MHAAEKDRADVTAARNSTIKVIQSLAVSTVWRVDIVSQSPYSSSPKRTQRLPSNRISCNCCTG
jgi:hypothetical protein